MGDRFNDTSPIIDKNDPTEPGFFGRLIGGGGDSQYTFSQSQSEVSNLAPTYGFFRTLKQGLETALERSAYFAVLGQDDVSAPEFFADPLSDMPMCVATDHSELLSNERRHGFNVTNLEWYGRMNALTDILNGFVSGADIGYTREGMPATLIASSMQTEPSAGLPYAKSHEVADIHASFRSWAQPAGTPIGSDDPVFAKITELMDRAKDMKPGSDDTSVSIKFSDAEKTASGLYAKGTGIAVDGWGDTAYDSLWTDKLKIRDAEEFPHPVCSVYWPLLMSYLATASRIMSAWYSVPGYRFKTRTDAEVSECSVSYDMFGNELSSTSTQQTSYPTYYENRFRAGSSLNVDDLAYTLTDPVIATFTFKIPGFVDNLASVDDPGGSGIGLVQDTSVEYQSDDAGAKIELSLWHRDYDPPELSEVVTRPSNLDRCWFAEGINNDGRGECYKVSFRTVIEKYVSTEPVSHPTFPGGPYGSLNYPTEYVAYAPAVVADTYWGTHDGKTGLYPVVVNTPDVSFDGELTDTVRKLSPAAPPGPELTLAHGWQAPDPGKLRVYYLLSRTYWEGGETFGTGWGGYTGSTALLAQFPQGGPFSEVAYAAAVKSMVSEIIGLASVQNPYTTDRYFLCVALPCAPQFSETIGKGGGSISGRSGSTSHQCPGHEFPNERAEDYGSYNSYEYASADCFVFTSKDYAPEFTVDFPSLEEKLCEIYVGSELLWWIKINSKFGKATSGA